ncbi:Endonuclease/exonuclease/phosphatase, partial [Mycena floridula]
EATHKWRRIRDLMMTQKIGVLTLLETKMTDEQIAEFEQSIYGRDLEVYHTAGTTSSCGVAVIFNRLLTNVEGIECYEVIPGRALCLKHPWHGPEVETILAVYAPTKKPQNGVFWNELTGLWQEYKLPIPTKVMGDMNVTVDLMDRRPHKLEDCESSRDAHIDFQKTFSLADGWRNKNPHGKDYTYITKDQQSRLDRIYTIDESVDRCRLWRIEDCTGSLSDHRLITVEVHGPLTPFQGKGRYSMQDKSLKSDAFFDEADIIGLEMQGSLETWVSKNSMDQDPQRVWASSKEEWIHLERERAK